MQEAKKPHDVLTQDIDALAHHLSTVSGMHVGIHDPERTTMVSGGDTVNNLCKFCSACSLRFSDRCRCDDRTFLNRALKEKKPITYRCHLGLTEMILPIIDEDAVVGVLFLGQVRITPDETMTEDAVFARLHAMDPAVFGDDCREALSEAYRGTCSMSEELFRSYCSLADYSASGVYVSNWLSRRTGTTEQHLRQYLQTRIDPVHIPLSELSVEKIAQDLYVSYSQLNRLSRRCFGVPLKQHILQIKIDAASQLLLRNETLSVRDIAAHIGIDNPFYFSRLFAERMGISCTAYRTLNGTSSAQGHHSS